MKIRKSHSRSSQSFCWPSLRILRTIKAPDHEYPSWLELREENGRLKAEMVGRWGNARPLASAELSNGRLKLVSPKEEEGSKVDLVFEGALAGKILSGTTNGPDGRPWQWTGHRAPALKRTSPPSWSAAMPLFNRKDLTGWHEDKPGTSPAWKVENGALITPGNGPELINNSKMVTVVQNGKTVIDNKEIPGITGGALDSHEELPGPIYLQGSEKDHVLFRSIVLTPAAK